MSGVCLLLAIALIVYAMIFGAGSSVAGVLEKIAFAVIVALGVRWLNVVFEENQPPQKADIYSSSRAELYHAIENATRRIWICQTWLPGGAGDASKILERNLRNTRLLVTSFKHDSAIRARIAARIDSYTEEAAKQNVANSVALFVNRGKQDYVRFNPIHHPGWIAIIDSDVFWGATPVERDNWSVDLLFHRARVRDFRASFWKGQFELLWGKKGDEERVKWSHNYEVECAYNNKLRKLNGASDITSKPGHQPAQVFLQDIRDNSSRIELEVERPFRILLRNRVLSATAAAVSEEAEWNKKQSGSDRYKAEVRDKLQPELPAPNATVLALCGEKGFENQEALRYFRQFYDFARNQQTSAQARNNDEQDRIRMCRIFVEPADGGFLPLTQKIMEEHLNNTGHGVLPLTIRIDERSNLSLEYPGIVERLDAGFGFLVFHHLNRRSIAITHEGKKLDLAYSVFRDPLNVREILSLFRSLCEISDEYEPNAERLNKLFERIQRDKE